MPKKSFTRTKLAPSAVDNLRILNPELVFGIVGPIGVDLDAVITSLQRELAKVDYKSVLVHLTDYIADPRVKTKRDDSSYYAKYKSLIAQANEFRKLARHPAAMAGLAIRQIRSERARISGNQDKAALGTAYIVRQFKRPEEIELMRQLYGRKFIQLSVYGSPSERRKVLMEKIRRFDVSPKIDSECERQAIELIEIDHNQKDVEQGQRLSDVFHLGDAFVDGTECGVSSDTMNRFVSAFFGSNGASPSKDEYGLYIATAASLRSIDLSRQVGAAIFSSRGEVVSLGCNEVPKARGGTYWTDDSGQAFRDFEVGLDPNQERRSEILYDLVDRMSRVQLFNPKIMPGSTQGKLNMILGNDVIRDAQIMDIIEFGRIIHAEMSAISDAARLGLPTKEATLFCTTFPCHLCAKHIVAAGIVRVVFLEPYPKSYALKLHDDSITFEKDGTKKVLFEPFIGISPRRYRDIFEKRKRKGQDGKAQEWHEGKPAPMLEDRAQAYIENELPWAYVALKELRANRSRVRVTKVDFSVLPLW